VEFIYGGKSDYYDAGHHNRLCQHYPQMKDGNFHKVPEAGHWVFAERPTEFHQILKTILQRDDQQ
jgi:pimeloyl-ACP methyl ester carboxylesterase